MLQGHEFPSRQGFHYEHTQKLESKIKIKVTGTKKKVLVLIDDAVMQKNYF
jgi:hypothetical protein